MIDNEIISTQLLGKYRVTMSKDPSRLKQYFVTVINIHTNWCYERNYNKPIIAYQNYIKALHIMYNRLKKGTKIWLQSTEQHITNQEKLPVSDL